MNNSQIDLGIIIKSIRQEKGLTSKYVSDQLGISPSTLSKYESNERKIKADMVPSFAKVLNVAVEDIYNKSTTN
ncbi:hypothetical protein PghCCS26_46580 [Paenibacillus glycanilyticus]|uniref:HTH cro/C1-type domain-containing protein n=1 Tax=Paenibacillus glycanilyticus TaxID=126569 RepID=A0ABQ6NSI9_9BACL|nr:helix-turn-helix transcriptional regulator [Paenibacillus glycanilyticus]GMK47528.1 hypothetical protein PghCCS26_46580 [Paenibacillus glycanilyticus]